MSDIFATVAAPVTEPTLPMDLAISHRGVKMLVFGGRNFGDRDCIYRVLDEVAKQQRIGLVINGKAEGVDEISFDWAHSRGYHCVEMAALWHLFPRNAGPIRNIMMLNWLQPDIAVMFPGGNGTANMEAEIEKRGGIILIKAEKHSSFRPQV